MRQLLYSLIISNFLLACAAEKTWASPRGHLSIYNTDYDAMTPRQLKERSADREDTYVQCNMRWHEEHKVTRCLGINCCFWGIAIPVAASEALAVLKHAPDAFSPFVGILGFVTGAYAAHKFADWYQPPPQPYCEQELREIAAALEKKKLKPE